MKKIIVTLLTAMLVFTGCATDTQKGFEAKPKQTAKPMSYQLRTQSVRVAEKAKEIAKRNQAVDEATAVANDSDLSVAVKVSNFDRFRLNNIRQDVHKRISKRFPEYKVHVSTDSKIFAEIKKMEGAFHEKKPLDRQKFDKQLKKINEDMKG